MIELGCKVKDKITGFTGVVVGKTEWLYGCVRCGVSSKELHNGSPIDTQWFDEESLELVEGEAQPVEEHDTDKPPAGPRNDPPSHRSGE